MSKARIPTGAAIAGVAAFLVLLVSCGGGGPEQRTFQLEFRGGEPVGGVRTFKAKQGDTVVLVYRTDAQANFHLHGYDVETAVEEGQQGSATLEVDATGRFEIEDEKTETTVGYLEIAPR